MWVHKRNGNSLFSRSSVCMHSVAAAYSWDKSDVKGFCGIFFFVFPCCFFILGQRQSWILSQLMYCAALLVMFKVNLTGTEGKLILFHRVLSYMQNLKLVLLQIPNRETCRIWLKDIFSFINGICAQSLFTSPCSSHWMLKNKMIF